MNPRPFGSRRIARDSSPARPAALPAGSLLSPHSFHPSQAREASQKPRRFSDSLVPPRVPRDPSADYSATVVGRLWLPSPLSRSPPPPARDGTRARVFGSIGLRVAASPDGAPRSPRLASPPHLTSPHHTAPHLTSPSLASPPRRASRQQHSTAAAAAAACVISSIALPPPSTSPPLRRRRRRRRA